MLVKVPVWGLQGAVGDVPQGTAHGVAGHGAAQGSFHVREWPEMEMASIIEVSLISVVRFLVILCLYSSFDTAG